jgi:hypothetical protein
MSTVPPPAKTSGAMVRTVRKENPQPYRNLWSAAGRKVSGSACRWNGPEGSGTVRRSAGPAGGPGGQHSFAYANDAIARRVSRMDTGRAGPPDPPHTNLYDGWAIT